MHNLFPPKDYVENLEDAASGGYDAQPRIFLRGRPYGRVPLKVMPKYEGDFLEKLRKQPLQGKPVMPLETVVKSSDPENIWDFSMPAEWLKHQEKPHPRNLVDQFYEITKPGEGVGEEVLKDYHDRSWDPEDAPEMSEDKGMRYGPPPGRPLSVPFRTASKRVVLSFLSEDTTVSKTWNQIREEYNKKYGSNHHCLKLECIICGNVTTCRCSKQKILEKGICDSCSEESHVRPSAGIVMSSFLMGCFPVDFILDLDNVKTAMLLEELQKSRIKSKTKGLHDLPGGVSIRNTINRPKEGRWVFITSSPGKKPAITEKGGWPWPYTTTFQFIPHGREKQVNKLHVRVSCTCPSWVFWGAQYNATMGEYRYGPIRPKFSDPVKRDPSHKFLACKHILACIPYLIGTGARGKFTDEGFTLHSVDVPTKKRKRIIEEPKFKIEKKAPKEKLRIPTELLKVGRRPNIKAIVSKWEKANPRQRRKWVMELKDPKEITYLAHRFPETSTHIVAKKLKELEHAKDVTVKKEAEEGLEQVEKIKEKMEEILPEISGELKIFENDLAIQELMKKLKETINPRKRIVLLKEQDDPDALAYIAIVLYREDSLEAVNTILQKLDDIAKNENLDDPVRKRAAHWSEYIY